MAEAAAGTQGRLAWRCRRGMKELDLVLMRYLQCRWPTADAAERAVFEEVLDLPDPLLAAYLMERETAPDPAMARLIGLLREG
jgi:antitoxin CptB